MNTTSRGGCFVGSLHATTLTIGIFAASLPSLAHAQLSNISQSGSAAVVGTVRDRSPQGDYTQRYNEVAVLKNLDNAQQTVKSAPSGSASASLTTSVGENEIRLESSVQGQTETKNFYSTAGVLQHITDISLNASVSATVNFTLSQYTDVIFLNLTPKASWAWTNLQLATLNDQGAVTSSVFGENVFALPALDAGNYRLSMSGSSSNGSSAWGLAMFATTPSAVPEPSTAALWALGTAGLLMAKRRKKG